MSAGISETIKTKKLGLGKQILAQRKFISAGNTPTLTPTSRPYSNAHKPPKTRHSYAHKPPKTSASLFQQCATPTVTLITPEEVRGLHLLSFCRKVNGIWF